MTTQRLFSSAVLYVFVFIQSVSAQTVVYDEVSMNPGNTDMVFYSIEDGYVSSITQSVWDLAFDVSPMGATIRINGGNGCELFLYGGIETWDDVDMAVIETLPNLYNDQSNWGVGAYSQGGDGMFDIGWGLYDVVTHIVTGNKVFVIKLGDGTLKKTKIVSLEAGEYKFVYSNIDGTDSQEISVLQSDYTDKNFVYFNFEEGMVMDLEPDNNSWNLVFLKYVADLGGGYYYPVTGCLANPNTNIQQLEGLADPFYDSDFSTELMSDLADEIGYDWKSYDMEAGVYNIVVDRCYFVSEENGSIWRIVFTAFEGSATGNVEMGILLEQPAVNDVSNLNVTDNLNEILLYPNPASNENVILEMAQKTDAAVYIYDSKGSIVLAPSIVNDGNFVSLQVKELSQGIYFVEVRADAASSTKRLIIE